jgi:imidazolonepropionase-like amidohydrolase
MKTRYLMGWALALISTSLHAEPFPSTYQAIPSPPTLIRNATLLIGNGERLDNANIYLANGEIQWVGDGPTDGNAVVIDAEGRWVTPGIIDVHSHLGVYPSPGVKAHSDGNEATAPVTAEVWAEHSLWPQDPGFTRALAGGITTLQILPGSANLFGGRGVTVQIQQHYQLSSNEVSRRAAWFEDGLRGKSQAGLRR